MQAKFRKLSEDHDAAITAALASPVIRTPDAVPADVIIKPRAPLEPLPIGAITRIERSVPLGSSDALSESLTESSSYGESSNLDLGEILPENLSHIKGLDPISITRLNDRGIVAFIQVAQLTDAEVKEIEEALDLPGCFNRYSWRYQAQQLHLEKNT